MRRFTVLTGIALLLLTLNGCGKPVETEVPRDPAPVASPTVPAADPEPIIPEIGSLLNGLPLDDVLKTRRPIAVMLDNQANARPQAGLSEADVVLEALAEGQITRYLAIFQSADPETIGPVRSARPYYIDRALEYDAYYVHAGGSMQALGDVDRKGVADLDALHEGKITFWRKNHKKAPHNLYTSPEALRNAAAARKYRTDWKGIPQVFSHEGNPVNGTAFTQVDLRFKEPGKGDSTGYTASFAVFGADRRLMRTVNGRPHQDEITQEPLYAENLIIQLASHRVIDSEGRLEVELIGSGTGYYCQGGEYWPITWQKTASDTPTVYSLADGTALRMKPGKLWIEIFPLNKTLEFK